MLIVLAGTSLAVLVPLLLKGRPLSGADGLLASDQLQYFAWIREASEHVLIGNRYDFAPGDRVFLHPGYLISGLLHRVTGLSIPLSYLLPWKPIAVGLTFAGSLLYVRRLLAGRAQRRIGLVLALFAVMPASAIVAWSGIGDKPLAFSFDFISGELWSGQYLLGYLMTAIAVFLMPLVLLAVESWRRTGRPFTLVLVATGALLITWLQPWQGATIALIVVATELLVSLRGRTRPRAAALAVPVAVAIPAGYYFALSRLDPAWQLAAESNAAGALAEWRWPWWAMALTVLPLALPAAIAYRLPAPTWQDVAVRVWPFAGLAVYLLPIGTFPYHAFQGLTLPLAILAVVGFTSVRPRPRPWLIVAALVLLIVPGFVHKLELAANSIRTAGDPYFILPDERRALQRLEDDPRPGGVLAPSYAGQMIPFTTGRKTYVGALSWTPDWSRRARNANDLAEGKLSAATAREVVRSSGARFLFVDCRPRLPDLTYQLGELVERSERFGCARLYTLRANPGTEIPGRPDQ